MKALTHLAMTLLSFYCFCESGMWDEGKWGARLEKNYIFLLPLVGKKIKKEKVNESFPNYKFDLYFLDKKYI